MRLLTHQRQEDHVARVTRSRLVSDDIGDDHAFAHCRRSGCRYVGTNGIDSHVPRKGIGGDFAALCEPARLDSIPYRRYARA